MTETTAKTVEYYMGLPYTTLIQRDADGDYVAWIGEVDGCIADGRTESEAITGLREAQRVWFEMAIDGGCTIPEPEPEEIVSGRFLLRVPISLHGKLRRLARVNDTSLNQLCVTALSEYLGRHTAVLVPRK